MSNLDMESLLFNGNHQKNVTTSNLKQPFSPNGAPQRSLRDHVEFAMRNYFANLDGEQASNVYEMLLAEVEIPLLGVVLEYTRGNQTRASEILGLNRGTLRKKLKAHGLM